MKTAFITGITGQDGSYLAELLLLKGYEVHGLQRRSSSFNTSRIDHIYSRLVMHHGDILDAARLTRILDYVVPDEIYNLAAQSHVQVSFENPEYTTQSTFIGAMNLFDAARLTVPTAKIYQASSSEMFGNSSAPQSIHTSFSPRSPYAIAKVSAHHYAQMCRRAYNQPIYCGILFNHESERRGETFVTRKITRALTKAIVDGKSQAVIYLGNVHAKRDWGHAQDYVRAMWMMLQQDEQFECVVGTGETRMVADFIEAASAYLGIGVDVRYDERYVRPLEVEKLQADCDSLPFEWRPEISFGQLVSGMCERDLALAQSRCTPACFSI